MEIRLALAAMRHPADGYATLFTKAMDTADKLAASHTSSVGQKCPIGKPAQFSGGRYRGSDPISPICAMVSPFFSEGTAPM
jgi:hypothetical protein